MEDQTWTTDSEGYQHDDERCAWQHASGLIGSGGDPSDVVHIFRSAWRGSDNGGDRD